MEVSKKIFTKMYEKKTFHTVIIRFIFGFKYQNNIITY